MSITGKRAPRSRRGLAGFSLVEMVIAIAVIALTFIGVIGLLGLGVANDQTSSEQTIATNIAASILADLRSTPGNIPASGGATYSISTKSPRFLLTMPTTDTTSSPPLSSVTPVTQLYFDNSPTLVQTGGTAPASAVYKASVYLTQLSHVGNGNGGAGPSQYNDLVRIVVSWPALAATNPSGSVDVISQFIVH